MLVVVPMIRSLHMMPCLKCALQVVLTDAGHFQFLDVQSALDRAVCTVGRTPDAIVRLVSQALMVAWGQLMIRERLHSSSDQPDNSLLGASRLQDLQQELLKLCEDSVLTQTALAFRSKGLAGAV